MSYVDKSIARREGECLRCGACCTLMFVCPFLTREGQLFACVKHERRPMNCSLFPIDERDLRDRDIVSPDTRCGYSFRKEN